MLALVALGLAACTDKYAWQNSRQPEDRQSRDTTKCQFNAENLVDDELRRASPFDTQMRGPLERQFTLFDARKRQDRLFAICMRDKGYKRVKLKPK